MLASWLYTAIQKYWTKEKRSLVHATQIACKWTASNTRHLYNSRSVQVSAESAELLKLVKNALSSPFIYLPYLFDYKPSDFYTN